MKKTSQNKARNALLATAAIVVSSMAFNGATASELVYQPQNPSFGGNPLNGPGLLNSAITTNKHKAPDIDSDRYGIEELSPLDQLNETIERLVVHQLATAASLNILDKDGKFTPGSLETTNFIITVKDLGGGQVSVTTYDKATGGTTTVEVNNL